ncbi:hypothetical protein W386_02728 [Staphylococcus aureus DAR116]|nr:hypothetical protein W386_02728 [Staphylococcus aureus DAR116]CAC7003568.1 membrane protein [Staphylococcus aureus]CXJ51446.1 membrane protein [Staphylococcus aureus]
MAFLLLHNYTDFILLVIYQTQSAQILFIFIDFLNFVALILVYLCTNPNNRGIDKIACVK